MRLADVSDDAIPPRLDPPLVLLAVPGEETDAAADGRVGEADDDGDDDGDEDDNDDDDVDDDDDNDADDGDEDCEVCGVV